MKKKQIKDKYIMFFTSTIKELIIGEVVKETKDYIEIKNAAFLCSTESQPMVENEFSSNLVLLPIGVFFSKENVITFYKEKILATTIPNDYILNLWLKICKVLEEKFSLNDFYNQLPFTHCVSNSNDLIN